MGTVIIALPQFVFRHVASQQFLAQMPLATWRTDGIQTTLDRPATGGLNHGHLPATARRVGFRSGIKEKDDWKGQWTAKAPNQIGGIIQTRVDRFEAIGDASKATI
jgi:hypothetical protein